MVPILTLSGCKGNINCIDTHPLDIKKFVSWYIVLANYIIIVFLFFYDLLIFFVFQSRKLL